jgi:hypothetical protein
MSSWQTVLYLDKMLKCSFGDRSQFQTFSNWPAGVWPMWRWWLHCLTLECNVSVDKYSSRRLGLIYFTWPQECINSWDIKWTICLNYKIWPVSTLSKISKLKFFSDPTCRVNYIWQQWHKTPQKKESPIHIYFTFFSNNVFQVDMIKPPKRHTVTSSLCHINYICFFTSR